MSCGYSQVFRNTNLSSSVHTNTCPSIPHSYENCNYILLPHATMTIACTIHRLYIIGGCAHMGHHVSPLTDPPGFPHSLYISKPAISRKKLCHTTATTTYWLQPAAQLPYMHTIIYGPAPAINMALSSTPIPSFALFDFETQILHFYVHCVPLSNMALKSS